MILNSNGDGCDNLYVDMEDVHSSLRWSTVGRCQGWTRLPEGRPPLWRLLLQRSILIVIFQRQVMSQSAFAPCCLNICQNFRVMMKEAQLRAEGVLQVNIGLPHHRLLPRRRWGLWWWWRWWWQSSAHWKEHSCGQELNEQPAWKQQSEGRGGEKAQLQVDFILS